MGTDDTSHDKPYQQFTVVLVVVVVAHLLLLLGLCLWQCKLYGCICLMLSLLLIVVVDVVVGDDCV